MFFLMLAGVMPCARVVGLLLLAPARGFGHRALHRAGDAVGIQNDVAVHVARGAADGLDQRGFAAQEAFLVGIQNGDQRAFGNVEPLAQQVDADQHVEGAEPQIADDLDALQRLHVGMHVAHADALLVHVFGEVFRHLLGERGDERAIAALRDVAAFDDEIVDLRFDGAHFDRRIDEAGGADHLLGEHAAGALHLPRAGRGARRKRFAGASRPTPRI